MQSEPQHEPADLASFDLLSNVDIAVLAELDHRKITFRELLLLEIDNIVVLNRPVGENIDVFVDRVLLGTAEILVVDDSLAVRVADLRDRPSATEVTDRLMLEEHAGQAA